MPLLANSDLVMSLVDNQMGDTQLYPDGPGATLETPKKTTVREMLARLQRPKRFQTLQHWLKRFLMLRMPVL